MLVCGLIPQVTFASWWNPFSWNWRGSFNTPVPTKIEPHEASPTPQNIIPTTITSETQIIQKPVITNAQTLPRVTALLSSQPTLQIAPVPAITASPTLQIQNVKNEVTKKVVKITWTTSLPSKSQLLLNNGTGKGYESVKGIGISHEIAIENPTPSAEYIYKIVARTNDGEITNDYYGSFSAVREFTATLEGIEKNCRVIYVKDSVGKPASYMTVSISGTYGDTTTIQIPRFETKTDIDGKIDRWSHCEDVETLRITGENLNTKLDVSKGISNNLGV